MFKTLFLRNVALLVAVVLAGFLLAAIMTMVLVVRPQTGRIADVSAAMIDVLSLAMEEMPESGRRNILESLNREGRIRILPAHDVPPDGSGYPTALERVFMRALASRLATHDEFVWKIGEDRRLWVRIALGGTPYWVSVMSPGVSGPLTNLMIGLAVAFVVALFGGLVIQRRIDRPLRRLAAGVESYDGYQKRIKLDEDAPEEIAAVARAFNRMTRRLDEAEKDRALMLAGVSHDLRTPLARLRLSLEMLAGRDPELDASAGRQVDQIERMLRQFLDFGRGGDDEEPTLTDVGAVVAGSIDDAGLAGQVAINVSAGLSAELRVATIRRAVTNLLVNAGRFGAPPISINAFADGATLAIEVCDQGPGIDPGEIERLSRPFARGDVARGGEGTGLGLAIVERAARVHDGTLSFARTPCGFCARLALPQTTAGS